MITTEAMLSDAEYCYNRAEVLYTEKVKEWHDACDSLAKYRKMLKNCTYQKFKHDTKQDRQDKQNAIAPARYNRHLLHKERDRVSVLRAMYLQSSDKSKTNLLLDQLGTENARLLKAYFTN